MVSYIILSENHRGVWEFLFALVRLECIFGFRFIAGLLRAEFLGVSLACCRRFWSSLQNRIWTARLSETHDQVSRYQKHVVSKESYVMV